VDLNFNREKSGNQIDIAVIDAGNSIGRREKSGKIVDKRTRWCKVSPTHW